MTQVKKKEEKSEKIQRRLKNLKPFKPGQSGNPRGRPKGLPNRSTIAKKVLKMKGVPPTIVLRNLKSTYPEFFKGKSERWNIEFLITLRLAQKALIKGDVRAYEAIMDSGYGKAPASLDLTSGGKPLPLLENVRDNDSNKKTSKAKKKN